MGMNQGKLRRNHGKGKKRPPFLRFCRTPCAIARFNARLSGSQSSALAESD
jgi:hypothetical protein